MRCFGFFFTTLRAALIAGLLASAASANQPDTGSGYPQSAYQPYPPIWGGGSPQYPYSQYSYPQYPTVPPGYQYQPPFQPPYQLPY